MLDMDFTSGSPAIGGEEEVMDEDSIELVRRLCTKASMVMEDASPNALLLPTDPALLFETLDQLNQALVTALSCVQAAKAIVALERVMQRSAPP